MEKVDKKFTWVIKNFSSLQSENIISDKFLVGGCKWHLSVYPKGQKVNNFLSVYLEVADYGSLPSGWRINTRYRFIVVHRIWSFTRHSTIQQHWFDEKSKSWGEKYMLSLGEIHDKCCGFLENGELKIIVEVELLEIIGKVEVNGFHILPSQVEFVSRMFKKHPEIASELRSKNPNVRTCYMNLLLCMIDSLRQSPHELTKDVLDEGYSTLESLTVAGFKLDWLKKKLDQVSEMKEREKDGEIRRQKIEKELKALERKRSDLKAQLEKEKSEALAAKTPISFI